MSNLKMFCITLEDDHFEKIKNLNYFPVGLGENITVKGFLRDNTNQNISNKNSFYGEYTFHYWLWKNKFLKNEKKWIGFCQYRKHWVSEKKNEEYITVDQINEKLLKDIPEKFNDYESILGEEIFINQFRLSKFIKKNFLTMLKDPSLIFNANKRTIKFHFDMMHGKGNLEKAIEFMNKRDQSDFREFVNTEVSFNPHNMFICKSYKILEDYYSSIFPWLTECERYFGLNLEGYGLKRIYGFLAERYMSFWFKKYTRYKTLPILFKDISDLD
tara:strand:- start:122 stop:937 length:816 start_codon:yes stop_codon:yes gene_type:complete